MESSLSKLEMDAVLQLIQLSGSSSQDFQLLWVNSPTESHEEREQIQEEGAGEEIKEESVGETSPSTENMSEEALPRRRKKFRPIAYIYRKTQPLTKNRRAHKRPKV